VLSEETSWSARPETSPDDKQVLFASYHGRQWRQYWVTTPEGAAPLPMTFGEFDRWNARWSPDGKRIALISNKGREYRARHSRRRRRRRNANHREQAALQDPACATDDSDRRRTRPRCFSADCGYRKRRPGGCSGHCMDARR
jgi:dipeptidyl aminopeptidase/acylaminoacyl peptidase